MWFLKLLVVLVGVHQVRASIKASAKDALVQGSASRTLAGFEKYTDDLVNAYLEKGETIREESPDCGIIRDYIETLHNASIVAHQGDLGVGDTCKANLLSCDTFFTTGDHQLDGLQSAVSLARTNHSQCRDVQAGACERSDSDKGFKESSDEADNTCELYDTYRKHTNQAHMPDCAKIDNDNSGSPDALDDLVIKADEGTTAGRTALNKMEACLVQMKNWLDTGDAKDRTPAWKYPGPPGLYPRMTECATNDGCCKDPGECMDPVQPPGHCCNLQNQFESKHCSYEMERQTQCTNLKHCWDTEKTDCIAACGLVEQRVLGRKLDNETMERISCLLNALTDTNLATKKDQLDACKSPGFQASLTDKLAFWDIDGCPPVYDVNPDHAHCQTDILGTCTPDWRTKEYDTWSDGLICTCEESCDGLYDNGYVYTGNLY